MIKSADQELYDALFANLMVSNTVYHKIPPPNTKYPYIHMGTFYNDINPTKDKYMGKVNTTLNVWGVERIDVSNLCELILEVSRKINVIGRFKWLCNLKNARYRIIQDNSTEEKLFHGVVEMEFKYMEV